MTAIKQFTGKDGGSLSEVNTTTAVLGAGEIYTGEWERNGFPDIICSCKSSSAGTLYFDFSNDRVNVDSFPSSGFDVAAGIHEFHNAVKAPRWFRVRFVNGATPQTYFRLYTYYGQFKQNSAPMNFNIADDADALVVKSVISGVGNTTASVTDHRALQVTPPPEGKTAFGDALVAQIAHELMLGFVYGINTDVMVVHENQSGAVTAANSMAVVSSGAAQNSSGALFSRDYCRYQPGHGSRFRFTGLFTAGVAGSTQIIGAGDESNGFFFGYNGTSFGILHRKNGSPEIRTLTINTKSSTNENITITLDGVSTGDVVPVTNGADATVTANEIAAYDYSDIGGGWSAYPVGNTVVFVSRDATTHSGAYSLSGATTAAGTFAQNVVGALPSETWIAQADWNGLDIFDGNGLSGVTLDPTKGNVFQIAYQWLGFGAIYFYIEDPDDGELHNVHTIEYANANTAPSLSIPSLPFMMQAKNTTNNTDVSVKSASVGAFSDGYVEAIGIHRGISASKILTGVATETPMLTIRNRAFFNSKKNQIRCKIFLVSASVEHTKAVQLVFYANATLVGASFSNIQATRSVLQKDTSATSFSGGTELFTISLGKTGNQIVDLTGNRFLARLNPGESITVTVKPNSGTGAEANISYHIVELQ